MMVVSEVVVLVRKVVMVVVETVKEKLAVVGDIVNILSTSFWHCLYPSVSITT